MISLYRRLAPPQLLKLVARLRDGRTQHSHLGQGRPLPCLHLQRPVTLPLLKRGCALPCLVQLVSQLLPTPHLHLANPPRGFELRARAGQLGPAVDQLRLARRRALIRRSRLFLCRSHGRRKCRRRLLSVAADSHHSPPRLLELRAQFAHANLKRVPLTRQLGRLLLRRVAHDHPLLPGRLLGLGQQPSAPPRSTRAPPPAAPLVRTGPIPAPAASARTPDTEPPVLFWLRHGRPQLARTRPARSQRGAAAASGSRAPVLNSRAQPPAWDRSTRVPRPRPTDGALRRSTCNNTCGFHSQKR
eukprot:scaffold10715_cov114-Isochrysis_galbana.AAC.7